MIDLSTIRPGNWLCYTPKRKYCALVSKGESVVVKGVLGEWTCSALELRSIRLSRNGPSLCDFQKMEADWFRTMPSGLKLKISYLKREPFLISDKAAISIYFVHDFQNAFFDLTGEELFPDAFEPLNTLPWK